MISAAARPFIDASVPVLREHGLAITRRFYARLFAAHPELSRIFNMGNQANGSQQQSLAMAVFAYAANIGNPGALGPVVSRIVHKHVSVGITAEHYPIVGENLLAAIQDVLGEAATPELIAAWAEAYGALAKLLIETEAALYGASQTTPGQTRPYRVTSVRQEAADIISLRLAPLDGLPLPLFRPGQYVSVAIDFADGTRQLRQYSLSDAPGQDSLRISVKREHDAGQPAGRVSNWIHDNVAAGSELELVHPFGDFTPDSESLEPVVLLSAGVGITPMIAVLNRIAACQPERRVLFAHAARNAAHHAHQTDVAAAQARMPHLQVVNFYEDQQGRMQISALPHWPRSETPVYLCGPLGFMREQWAALLAAGVPASRITREVFGPELLDHLL